MTSPFRAVKAALELRTKTKLQLQMGITKGLMLAGAYGGETRKTFSALGDDVNLAARLMTTAGDNEVLLSSHGYKAVSEHFTFEARPAVMVKGKSKPIPLYQLIGESRRRAMRLQEPNYSLPKVGRQTESDFISLHTPLTPDTRQSKMKPNAVLINTSRGSVVDLNALYNALKSERIFAAALYVTEPEPLPMDSPLLTLKNLVIAPHIASASKLTRDKMSWMAAKNLIAGLKGDRLPNCINPRVYSK